MSDCRLYQHPQQTFFKGKVGELFATNAARTVTELACWGRIYATLFRIHFPKESGKQKKEASILGVKKHPLPCLTQRSQYDTAHQSALTAEVLRELSLRKRAELATPKQRFRHQQQALATKKTPKQVTAVSTGWAWASYTPSPGPLALLPREQRASAMLCSHPPRQRLSETLFPVP